jgi:hypothetical protein
VQVELPELEEKDPNVQGKQVLDPSVPMYCPTEQLEHDVWPIELAKEPAAQEEHTAAAGRELYVPGEHS